MSENDSYALWIMPVDEAVYALTSGYIARLSGLYSLPGFEPHITVLGGVSMPEMVELSEMAGSLRPFQIRLVREVEYRDEYFRCLFLRAYKTPELMEVFSKSSSLFGQEDELYFPHLSLAYGDLPVWKKQEMIAELGPIPEIAFEAREISLVQASKDVPVENWKVIRRFPLASIQSKQL
jgi:2'-5' RNA ligase